MCISLPLGFYCLLPTTYYLRKFNERFVSFHVLLLPSSLSKLNGAYWKLSIILNHAKCIISCAYVSFTIFCVLPCSASAFLPFPPPPPGARWSGRGRAPPRRSTRPRTSCRSARTGPGGERINNAKYYIDGHNSLKTTVRPGRSQARALLIFQKGKKSSKMKN